jgi:REP-associated tyrosine transposase
VIARHTYKVEQMATLLKGGATRRIVRDERHPLAEFGTGTDCPKMWAEKRWKVYLDSEQQIETAIRYVEENPDMENKPRQHWNFVEPFRGLDPGNITYH